MSAYATAAADPRQPHHPTERDNLLVWERAQTGHYEVYYLTFNHRPSKTGFWIRYTLEAPLPGHGEPYAQLWFAFFDALDPTRNFALNRRVPIDELRSGAAPFRLALGQAVLGHDHARGALEGDGHAASWDLTWLPAPATHRHLPGLVYRTSFADTRVLSPNLDVPLRGTVTVDGRTLSFEGEPGAQTHLWGRKHAHAWAWSHCNAFEGRRGAVVETLTVRLRRRGVVLPPLTIGALYLDGEEHRLTGFRDTLLNRGRYGTARYQFVLQGASVRVAGEVACRPEDMVQAEYADPDGEPSFCANTEVADLRVTVWRRARLSLRWLEQARLIAEKAAHFEVAGRERDPAIQRRHVTL
jgi:hypothetical protein